MKRLLQRDSTENDSRELRNLSPNAFLSHAPTNSEAARIITEHATNGVNSSKKHGKSTNQSRKQDDKNYPSGIGSSNFYSRTLSTQAIQSNPNSSQKKQQNNKGGAKKVRIVQNSQNSGASSSQSSIAQVVHAVSNQAVINNSLPSLSDLASIDNTLVNNRLRPATLNPDPPSGNFGYMNDNSNNEDYTMNMYPSDLDATFYEVMDYATGFNATHAVATSSGENLQHYSAVSNYENLEMCSGQNGEVLHNGEILQTDENGYVISGHNFVTYANHGPSCDDCGKPCQCSEEAHASGYGCFSSAGTPSNFVSSFADTTSNSASDSENTRLEIALGSVDSPGNDDSYGRGEGDGEGKSQPLIINGRIVECVVCGDKSSGKHYGQFTCEGCKSFFKRSVRRGLSYACRSNGLCPVDQQNRNQCQGCRLAKCMQVGMRKEAVQRGRILASPSPRPLQLTSSNYQDPNSPHRYHPQNQINQHVPSSTSSSQHLAMFNRGSNMSRSMSSSDHNSLNSPYYGHQNGAMNGSPIRNERQAYHRQEMDHQRRLECNSPLESDSGLSNGRSLNPGLVYGNYSDLVSMLLKAEPPTACTRFNQSCSPSGLTSPSKSGQGQLSKTPIQSNHGGSSVIRGGDECGRGHSVETVCEMAARLLFCAVQWASSIPYFPQLPLNDQVALLRLTWSEMFVLNAAQCYLPLISLSQNNNNISSTSSNQTSIPNKRTNNISNSSSNGTSKHTNGTTSQNNTKQDSHSSLAEKKELLSNQIRLLEEQVEKLQNLNVDDAEYSCLKCIVLFTPDAAELSDDSHIESIQEKATLALEEYISLTYPDQQGRMGKLLLRLPALRSIGAPVVEHMYFERLVGKTAIDTLIKDMLLSGTNYNWGP